MMAFHGDFFCSRFDDGSWLYVRLVVSLCVYESWRRKLYVANYAEYERRWNCIRKWRRLRYGTGVLYEDV